MWLALKILGWILGAIVLTVVGVAVVFAIFVGGMKSWED